MRTSSHKAFTLIELLVVIAIIAILAVVVILTLNPAELLRQSTAHSKPNLTAITTTTITASPSSTSFHVPTSTQHSGASSSWVSLQVNGSHGPISLGLGSNVN